MADIGVNIANARKKAGMSQEDLALKVGYKTRSAINKIEMGKRDLPQRKVVMIAHVLGVSPAALLGDAEIKPENNQGSKPVSIQAEESIDEFELISDRIRNAMKRANLSYGELSALTGISKSSLYRYASGFTPKIPLNRLEVIAKALNVTPSYLIGWDDTETGNPSISEESPNTEQQEAPASSKAEALDSFESIKAALMRVIDERTGGRPLTVQERTVIESAFKLLSTMFDDPE